MFHFALVPSAPTSAARTNARIPNVNLNSLLFGGSCFSSGLSTLLCFGLQSLKRNHLRAPAAARSTLALDVQNEVGLIRGFFTAKNDGLNRTSTSDFKAHFVFASHHSNDVRAELD